MLPLTALAAIYVHPVARRKSATALSACCAVATGKYIAPKCEHLAQRVAEIENGDYVTLLEKLKNMPLDEIKDLYNKREIEK